MIYSDHSCEFRNVYARPRERASWGITKIMSFERNTNCKNVAKLCGAKTRTGLPCKARRVVGKKRCRMHGGLSTGPKTEAGRMRISEAQKKRWIGSRLSQPEV